MLFFVISFLPFLILLSKSISLQPLPSWATEIRLLSLFFLKEVLHGRLALSLATLRIPREMLGKRKVVEELDNAGDTGSVSIFDLPELALDNVLERLPPAGLRNMERVCTSLRDRCRSDHLWGRHMREKWGRVIGEAARREWSRSVASRMEHLNDGRSKSWIGTLLLKWPLSWLTSRVGGSEKKMKCSLPAADSIMSWYLSLESGEFWFPAQVYNRENGHVGFILSCYDAELSYDWRTDTFRARYPPHGRRTLVVEDGIQWDRIREPPIGTSAHELHASDCLSDLRPGDHIEIQWRRNKEFPYGWWYGAVGHLETCDETELRCLCHKSDTLVLEFKQYVVGSRWRRAAINRKDHREGGNEIDGFYGGIRMLKSKEEINMWKQLWPTEMLE